MSGREQDKGCNCLESSIYIIHGMSIYQTEEEEVKDIEEHFAYLKRSESGREEDKSGCCGSVSTVEFPFSPCQKQSPITF